jgi:HSP20 family molecular chaperone IbpA
MPRGSASPSAEKKAALTRGPKNMLGTRCGMKERVVVDLGKIMDEIFEAAEKVGNAFQENFDLDNLSEKLKFKWDDSTDYYPTYSYPPCNVYMRPEKSLVFEFALAGFDEKKIDLEFRGDYLVFSAKLAEDVLHEEKVRYFKRRLKFKDVIEQRYYVPEDKFDRDEVKAVFKNGVLKVTVPPREEALKTGGVKIEIVKEEEA